MNKLKIVVRGGGDLATGVICRLFKSGLRKICVTEINQPQAVRRTVAFCEAVHDREKTVEGVCANVIASHEQIVEMWDRYRIPIIVDPEAKVIDFLRPDVVIDAILAKKNVGTKITDTPLVIGLGPGFYAGRDAHLVVETNRGHNLGRLIHEGEAEENTGIPGVIAGYASERVFRAPKDGRFTVLKEIGDSVKEGEWVAEVDGLPVKAKIKGVIRGIIRDGTGVWKGMKAGDIDPRGKKEFCYSVSEKSLAIAGGVLEGILYYYNQ